MEGASCVEVVVKAANQYQVHMSDSNLIQLQRQLDVLVSITKKDVRFFNPKELLYVECIRCLVDMLKDPETKPPLVQKVMQLLSNLANDWKIRECLSNTFHVANSLTHYLHPDTNSEENILLCLATLQKVIYGTKVSFQESYVEDLIMFLLEHIPGKHKDTTEPCLGVMASICRNNFSIQTHVKNKECTKLFYKSLLANLANANNRIVIFSLSILLSLGFGTDIGDKLFSAKNINKTFMLMFNILLNDNDLKTRTHVVDLFVDMLRHKKIQQYLSVYTQLAACLGKLFLLAVCHPYDTATKIFELLLSFCKVNSIRCVVCKTLLESPTLKDPVQYKELLKENQVTEPFFAVVHWAAQSVLSHDDAPLHALDFLKEIYEEMLSLNLNVNVSPRTDLVLPMLADALASSIAVDQQPTEKQCLKVIKALTLLKTISLDDSIQLQLAQTLNIDTYKQLLNFQLTHNKLPVGNHNHIEQTEWSAYGVDIVFRCLDILVQLERYVDGIETALRSVLQDQRIVPFLAHGMLSDNREVVQVTLTLITKASNLDQFPLMYLGDAMASLNSCRCKKEEVKDLHGANDKTVLKPVWFNENKENIPSIKESSISNNYSHKTISSDMDDSVASIIDKMHTGLEIKDMKTSEIMSVYDHRLQSLQTKENHLQDLLEAKSMALEQADRLIAQYRCRKAQADAESQKIRKLIRASEKQNEELRESLNDAMLEKESMQNSIEQLAQDNARLESIAEDHKDLSQAYSEQAKRLENAEKCLSNLKQEHKAVTEMHEMLRRHNETLKKQHDVASQQLAELEEERQDQSKQVKEKDIKIADFTKSLKKTEDRLKKLETDRDDLEVAIDKLRCVLDKTEQAKKELQQKVETLELVCRQHETDIREKEGKIQGYKTELDKHAQIAALIHNLSGGKVPPK